MHVWSVAEVSSSFRLELSGSLLGSTQSGLELTETRVSSFPEILAPTGLTPNRDVGNGQYFHRSIGYLSAHGGNHSAVDSSALLWVYATVIQQDVKMKNKNTEEVLKDICLLPTLVSIKRGKSVCVGILKDNRG